MAERERYAFKREFEPIADVDDIIRLMPINRFYSIVYAEPIPKIDLDFGPFTAGQTKTDQELTDLYMPSMELAQYRFVPIDDVWVIAFYQPRKRPKWITKATGGQLTRALDYLDPVSENLQLTEFFVFEDGKTFVDLYAPSALTTSRIRFYGFRFVLEAAPARPAFKVPTIWYEAYAPRAAVPPAR
jgi:hypothetical protein